MFDIKWIRENPQAFDRGLERRGLEAASATVLDLDARRREALTELQDIQATRNEASRAIGAAKQKGEDADHLIAQVATLRDRMKDLEETTMALQEELDNILESLPNLPAENVPQGADEEANEELERIGEPRDFNFEPRQHFDIGEDLGLMDFEAASRLSGSRFVVLKGDLAKLERAIGLFMLDVHTGQSGYTEISPPLLVREETAFGTGNLPKFAGDAFQTTNGYWLIPTAEMALTNLVREQILEEGELPLRYVAMTPNFRSEAGAAGRDTRGMIRQHQFMKVELVTITTPGASEEELERMTLCARKILDLLEIPYRIVILSTGDMGFAAQTTYDLEAWLPGQDTYREISSCSNCGDFQARRMDARYRPQDGKGTEFVHTLNGSGLAIGRTLVAVLENYQQQDGSVEVPEALRPYMGGQEVIA